MLNITEQQLRTAIANALLEASSDWTEAGGEVKLYITNEEFEDVADMVTREVKEL